MNSILRKPRSLILLGLLGVVIMGLVAFQRSPNTVQVEGYLDPEQKIYYVAGEMPDSPAGFFFVEPNWHSSPTTIEDIEYYVQASHDVGQQLLDEGVQDFYVGVTLRNYMAPDDLDELASNLGLKVTDFVLRATYPNFEFEPPLSIFGAPVAGKILKSDTRDSILQTLRNAAREKKADRIAAQRTGELDADWADTLEPEEFKAITVSENDYVLNGVFTFEAVTNREGYQRLLQDQRVYHVDVTATLVYQQLKELGVGWEEFIARPNLGDYDPFAYMEFMGLEKFK